MIIVHRRDYREERAKAYPPIGDQLDAIWKALYTQKGLPAETQEIMAQVVAVKRTYPKE